MQCGTECALVVSCCSKQKLFCGLLKAVAECHPLNRWVYIDVNLEAFDWSMLHVVGKILLVAGVCILRSFLTF